MKNIKHFSLFFMSLFLFSCNNDDDNSPPIVAKEYFPTKITTEFPSYPNSNTVTSIEYDNKNRIIKLKYEKTNIINTYEIIYDSKDLISLVKFTRNNSGTVSEKTFLFNYLNSYLRKYQRINNTNIISINVLYDIATKTYTFEGYPTEHIKFNEEGDVIDYYFRSGVKIQPTYNNNRGVFVGANSLMLLIATLSDSESDPNAVIHSSLLFSNKEINNVVVAVVFGATNYIIQSTRAENNTISNFESINSSTGNMYSSSNIEYELRPIN